MGVVVELPEAKTISQICRELGVHRRTVERWIERGKLNAVRVGRMVVVLLDRKFDLFVEKMERKARWREVIRSRRKGRGNLATLIPYSVHYPKRMERWRMWLDPMQIKQPRW